MNADQNESPEGPEGAGTQYPTVSGQGAESAPCCAKCAGEAGAADFFVYSLGRLEVRFPTLGIEREFQQRERALRSRDEGTRHNRRHRIAAVLRENPHLARAVCFVHMIGGIPAYIVIPASSEVLRSIIDALVDRSEEEAWDLIIGRGGPLASPAACGGVLAPIVTCDQVYAFALRELVEELATRASPALEAHNIGDSFAEVARDLFQRIALSTENVGSLDSHRALNYLLVQHPGVFLAATERAERSILDSIETRVNDLPSARRVVTVILTFIDRATGVPERFFSRVDVTEEWPFVADSLQGGAATLGFARFVDHGASGSLA